MSLRVGYLCRVITGLSYNNVNNVRNLFIYSKYSFSIRAYSTTKYNGCDSTEKQQRLLTVVSGFPKSKKTLGIDKILKGQVGEDAYFVARYDNSINPDANISADVIGIADGVGGWRQFGVDPSKFSRQLMQNCEKLVTSGNFLPNQPPTQLLSDAYLEMKESKKLAYGSSTACLAMFDHVSAKLFVTNMGDSGLFVVRNGELAFCTQEQTHCFNTPFQLSLPPPGHMENGTLVDDPEDADVYAFNTQEGDIIILATDGVFDNVPLPTLVKQASRVAGYSKDLDIIQESCNLIATTARKLSLDEFALSPFARNAILHGYRDMRGGKEDDITVVMSVVTKC